MRAVESLELKTAVIYILQVNVNFWHWLSSIESGAVYFLPREIPYFSRESSAAFPLNLERVKLTLVHGSSSKIQDCGLD